MEIEMNGMIEELMKLHKCADCPIRCNAVKRPKSIFARIHRWHKNWWPGWKIYQRDLRTASAARAASAA